MDTEEYIEIEKAIGPDRRPLDEGFYYHAVGQHDGNRLVLWKAAVIGLAAGLAAGALLVFGGAAEYLSGLLGHASPQLAEARNTGIIIAMGLLGAGFGVNRAMFHRTFDKNNLWFKALFMRSLKPSAYKSQYTEKSKEKFEPAPIITMVYPADMADFPASDTHFRDKKKADLALLKLDPSKTVRQ